MAHIKHTITAYSSRKPSKASRSRSVGITTWLPYSDTPVNTVEMSAMRQADAAHRPWSRSVRKAGTSSAAATGKNSTKYTVIPPPPLG